MHDEIIAVASQSPRFFLAGTNPARSCPKMVKRVSDMCITALLLVAAVVWLTGIGTETAVIDETQFSKIETLDK